MWYHVIVEMLPHAPISVLDTIRFGLGRHAGLLVSFWQQTDLTTKSNTFLDALQDKTLIAAPSTKQDDPPACIPHSWQLSPLFGWRSLAGLRKHEAFVWRADDAIHTSISFPRLCTMIA